MEPYLFQSEDFALSDNGIHLLRNRFNFKTLSYDEIQEGRIARGSEIRNTPVVLAIGSLLTVFAIYQTGYVIHLFNDPNVSVIYSDSILIILFPALIGAYCIYIALKKGPMLRLSTAGRIHRLRLRSIMKQDQFPAFETYLRKQLGPRLEVDYHTV